VILYSNVALSLWFLVVQNNRAVLLIPDIYQRRCVRELVDVLLLRLGFAAVFVVQVTINILFINPLAT